ncbi:MAG TPA: cytochrome c oxidase assembly protein [Gaiella sp.]|nr:cytochrome c oxidase assembly protein [Gaiella sp.]
MPSPWSVRLEPEFLVLAAGAAFLYARAWRRAPGPAWRAWCFGAGLVLVAGALNSQLGTIAINYLVLFHLLQNVMISDWAPPLLLIGLTPAMREEIAMRGGSLLETITRPAITLPTWLVAWYVIHLGAVYDAAVQNGLLLALEHAVLIAVGLLFWWPVLCDVPRSLPTLGRIGYVFAAFVLSAFLGLALTFSPPVYGYYEDLPVRLWGITARQDQNLGGILMSTEQAIVFFAAIVWLLVRLLREETEAEERLAAEQRAAGLREH